MENSTPPPTKLNFFNGLLMNVRFYVLLSTFTISLILFIYYMKLAPAGSTPTIKLTQSYALLALLYLYIAVMATPLTKTFAAFPFRGIYIKARRGIGVSAFYFAALHAGFAFFGQLGGFAGLGFLPDRYLLAISLSFTALIILSLMASTSFDFAIAKLGFTRWKILHRFVYLALLLVIIHGLMLGTHFSNLLEPVPQISFIALCVLLFLEATRLDNFLQQKLIFLPKVGISVIAVCFFVFWYFTFLFFPASKIGSLSLSIHRQHNPTPVDSVQIANNLTTGLSNPALEGDRTKRYSVTFLKPPSVEASKTATLSFKVNDAANGEPVIFFTPVYSQAMHLIIVDSKLDYFNHLHPQLSKDGFTIDVQFPQDGRYHLYTDFQPLGAIEQQFAFVVEVGANLGPTKANTQPDSNTKKQFGSYNVELIHSQPLRSANIAEGTEVLSFKISDANTGEPVSNLKPYLASFGHLVLINQETYEYLHVHPKDLNIPQPGQNGGPVVDFLPMRLYGPVKPGLYRAFAQFNPDNNLFTADFTVKVE